MVRAAAVLRVILCAWVLGTALPAAAQVTASFTPDRGAYERLGKPKKSQATLPAHYVPRGSQNQSLKPSKRQVMEAIWNASKQTGVEYSYLLAQAHLESGLNPDAKARTSSAAGLYQFIEGTWLRSLDRYQGQLSSYAGANDYVSGSIPWAALNNREKGASRQEKLEWRHDPQLASLVAAAYALENGKRLERVLGRSATSTELYMAHFLGTGGASRFMAAWKRNPGRIAAYLFPKAARANRSVFFTRAGSARSLQGVLRHFDNKIDSALALFDMRGTEDGAVGET